MITGTGTNLGFEDDVIDQSFQTMVEKSFNGIEEIKAGIIVEGVISLKNEKRVLIDFGGKASINVENSAQENGIIDGLSVSDTVQVLITKITDRDNFELKGSLYGAMLVDINKALCDAVDERHVYAGIPIGLNHAGYNVLTAVEGTQINLFMPHLLADVNKLPNQEVLLNTQIEFTIEKTVKEGQTTYIASRKGYLQTLIKDEMRQIKRGQQVTGAVTGTTDFAIFVQFNTCLTGMLHKSNLDEETLAKFEEIKPGDEVTFYIKDIIKNRLFLSQNQLPSLWDTARVGDIVEGTVSSVKDFGVMVDLDYDTRGLIHKSMLKPSDKFNRGEKLKVAITNIDKSKRQMTLQIRN